MKKSIISMMIIGMMVFGTTTSFGKTNNHSVKNSPKVEVIQKHSKQNGKKQCNCPECQKLNKKTKSGSTCKMQQNTHKMEQPKVKVQPQHK